MARQKELKKPEENNPFVMVANSTPKKLEKWIEALPLDMIQKLYEVMHQKIGEAMRRQLEQYEELSVDVTNFVTGLNEKGYSETFIKSMFTAVLDAETKGKRRGLTSPTPPQVTNNEVDKPSIPNKPTPRKPKP